MLRNTLRITLVQVELFWNQPEKNRNKLHKILCNITDTDIVVLPELFTTAFCLDSVPEKMNGKSIAWMSKISRDRSFVLCGSLPIVVNKKKYNRFIWANPKGEIEFYDKRHLFSLASEDKFFEQGNIRKVFTYKSWRILPQICYDLRFPVFTRNDLEYDVIINVANWPSSRMFAWKTLLPARAIENQAYVVGVNRLGTDPKGNNYEGFSVAYNFRGEKLIDLGCRENFKTVTLSYSKLVNERKKYPFLKNMDSFILAN
tara:strand:+ start:3627 stop:4400 length:774 start_codon:yes stop_codon:yes gene_type:complete